MRWADGLMGFDRLNLADKYGDWCDYQEWYDANYDLAQKMLAEGIHLQRLNYSGPNLDYTADDYRANPLVSLLFVVEHSDGHQTKWYYEDSSGIGRIHKCSFQAPDAEGHTWNIRGSLWISDIQHDVLADGHMESPQKIL
jgi:hypothetical protein